MVTEEKLIFYTPDKQNLEILENLNLRYKEMIEHYEVRQTINSIKYYFNKFGIHHKTKKELIRDFLERDPFHSTQQVAIKYGVSARLVNMVKAELPKMTYIKIWYDGENKEMFHCIVSGHARYDTFGRDIVCAAISTITIYTINFMSEVKGKDNVSYTEKSIPTKSLEIAFKVECDYDYCIASSLAEHLLSLSQQYPENVRVII